MKVQELVELLSSLNPEAEIQLNGYKQTNHISGFSWESEKMEHKHLDFTRDNDDKLTVHISFDV